ncbi:MAG: flagellar biosynthetic protein FliQ [Kofleriaceae bacterium]
MSAGELLELWRGGLMVAAAVAAPFVLAALAVGLVMAIVQTATQLQESVLVFAPKLAAALLVLLIAGSWCLDRLQAYALWSFTSAAGGGPW